MSKSMSRVSVFRSISARRPKHLILNLQIPILPKESKKKTSMKPCSNLTMTTPFNPFKKSMKELKEALKEIGYPVTLIKRIKSVSTNKILVEVDPDARDLFKSLEKMMRNPSIPQKVIEKELRGREDEGKEGNGEGAMDL